MSEKPKAKVTPSKATYVQLTDGRAAEMLFDPANQRTRFAVFNGKEVAFAEEVGEADGARFAPLSPHNVVLKHRVVLFPSEATEYGTTRELIARIRAYIRAYVDVSENFELLAAYYVLFTWVHDRFNELPYLRLQGEYGTGKTRFLIVVGSICRTPIFAGGASTTAPIFHMLDRFGGTLIIDEADFRLSDEKAQIAKILNNGNARGFPVLRAESTDGREFNPRAYQVFGPKLIAMRGEFEDRALESRFITERSDRRALRRDIPLNLPSRQEAEALDLRNQLLTYRYRHIHDVGEVKELVDKALDARINQVFSPVMSIMADEEARQALRQVANERQQAVSDDRGASHEAGVLATICQLAQSRRAQVLPVADIAELFSRTNARDVVHPVSGRWVGTILRRSLGLHTRKSHGVYVLPTPDLRTLTMLRKRYSVTDDDIAHYAEFDLAEMLRVEPISGTDGSP